MSIIAMPDVANPSGSPTVVKLCSLFAFQTPEAMTTGTPVLTLKWTNVPPPVASEPVISPSPARITRSAPFALAAISLKPIRSLASAGVASSSPRAGRVASAADPIRAEPQPAPGNRLSRTSPVWGCSQCVECPALCANCFPRNARAESNPGAACFRLIGCRRRRFAFGHLMGTRGRTRSSNPSWVDRHTSRRGATCGLRCFHSPQYLGATPDAKWVPLADALRTWLLAPAPEVLETPECFRSSQRAGSASDGLLVTVVPRVRLPTGGLPWTSNHLPPR